MKTTTLKDILNQDAKNQKISASGWVRTKRSSKNLAFIELNDGSCQKNLQIIVNEDCTNFSKISEVSTGASITVNGLLTPSPAKKQAIELLAQILIIHGRTTSSYPLQKKGHSI